MAVKFQYKSISFCYTDIFYFWIWTICPILDKITPNEFLKMSFLAISHYSKRLKNNFWVWLFGHFRGDYSRILVSPPPYIYIVFYRCYVQLSYIFQNKFSWNDFLDDSLYFLVNSSIINKLLHAVVCGNGGDWWRHQLVRKG